MVIVFGRQKPLMTSREHSPAYNFAYPSTPHHPGGHVLGVESLMLLLVFQRFTVPLGTGLLVGPVFTGTSYNVRQKAQVLFPWNVWKQKPTPMLQGGGCLPVQPSVLIYKLKKFCCFLFIQANRDKSFHCRYLVYILIYLCPCTGGGGEIVEPGSGLGKVWIPNLLPEPRWAGIHALLCCGLQRSGCSAAGMASPQINKLKYGL